MRNPSPPTYKELVERNAQLTRELITANENIISANEKLLVVIDEREDIRTKLINSMKRQLELIEEIQTLKKATLAYIESEEVLLNLRYR